MPGLLIAGVGPMEVLVVVLLVVVIFGAKRLPQLGAGLGQGIRNFKKSVTGEDEKETPAKTTAE